MASFPPPRSSTVPARCTVAPRTRSSRRSAGWGRGTGLCACSAGAALSLLVVAGVAQAPALALLWACYLSLSVVGQTFLWFQWDGLLLETGLLALLYAPTRWLPRREREREIGRAHV